MSYFRRRAILLTIATIAGGPALFLVRGEETASMFTGLVLVLIGAICGVSAVVNFNTKRKRVFRRLAEYRHMNFLSKQTPIGEDPNAEKIFGWPQPDIWPASADFAGYFPLFQEGSVRYVGPCAYGTDNDGILWFLLDFRRVDGSGWGCVEQQFSLIVAKLPFSLPVANISTGRKTLPWFIFMGLPEVLVEPKEDFKPYQVWSDNHAWASKLMTPETMQPLLDREIELLQTNGPCLMLIRPTLSSDSDLKLDREAMEKFIARLSKPGAAAFDLSDQ